MLVGHPASVPQFCGLPRRCLQFVDNKIAALASVWMEWKGLVRSVDHGGEDVLDHRVSIELGAMSLSLEEGPLR